LGEASYHHIFTSLGDGASQLQLFADRVTGLPALPPPALEEMEKVFSQLLSPQDEPSLQEE